MIDISNVPYHIKSVRTSLIEVKTTKFFDELSIDTYIPPIP